jgi:YNFM family putative membrane transporter
MILPSQIILITVFSTIFVATYAIFIPILITFIGEAAADNRSTAISLYSFLLLTGASIGPLVANFLPFHLILLLFASIFGLAIIIFYFTN